MVPARTNPLQDMSPIEAEGIHINYAGPRKLTQIRARGGDLSSILPICPLATMLSDQATILWLGPDEWLIVGDPAPTQNLLGMNLKASVDVSHRTLCISLGGVNIANLLNAACPLDLDERTTPPASTVRSHFGKTAITLHRTAAQGFDLYTNRSYSQYVWMLLLKSAQEFKTRHNG